jgi:hypothetical protein
VTTDHDDALRARLAALDPVPPSLPVDPPTSPRAQDLLERVMLTTEQTPQAAPAPRWRKPAAVAAAAAAVVAIGVGAVAMSGGDGKPTKAPTTLALTAPASGGGTTTNSCIAFSVDILRDMPVAFAGTVSAVGGSSVTLDVDRWYKGGDADVVTIATPEGNVSIDTVEFVTGKRYLVTATEGVVNSCGYTAEATPDLEKAFDEAFAP